MGIKFWIERLIINRAEETGFTGAQFHDQNTGFLSLLQQLAPQVFDKHGQLKSSDC